MDRKEAQTKIAEALKKAEEALKEAREVADEAQISFSWDGPEYGMGGSYQPRIKEWSESGELLWESSDAGWVSSSDNC